MKHTTCDECKDDIRTGTGINVSFPYSSIQPANPQKPADFCSWVCVERYAHRKNTTRLPGHNG